MGVSASLLLLLLFVVCSSSSLLYEAQPLPSSATKENLVTAERKGGGRSGGHGGGAHGDSSGSSHGYNNGDSSSPYGKAIPSITEGATVPKTSGFSSHKRKHNAAHSGHSFSIAAFLIISAFWFESLACLYRLSY